MNRYPHEPGHYGSDTSRAAAEAMSDTAHTLQTRCLAAIQKSSGLTADEVAAQLKVSILAIRPRITELHTKGAIKDSQQRRQNASGKSAIVWVGADHYLPTANLARPRAPVGMLFDNSPDASRM